MSKTSVMLAERGDEKILDNNLYAAELKV